MADFQFFVLISPHHPVRSKLKRSTRFAIFVTLREWCNKDVHPHLKSLKTGVWFLARAGKVSRLTEKGNFFVAFFFLNKLMVCTNWFSYFQGYLPLKVHTRGWLYDLTTVKSRAFVGEVERWDALSPVKWQGISLQQLRETSEWTVQNRRSFQSQWAKFILWELGSYIIKSMP